MKRMFSLCLTLALMLTLAACGSAAGPAMAGIVVMVSMMALVGNPITWQRLSVIGSAQLSLS